MKYVITGGAGFIGSHLTKALVKQDHDVTVIDNLQTGKEENLKSIKDKIVFSSFRKGETIGNHEVIFSSPDETINLGHIANNRGIFAAGAIYAAKWGQGKKPGLFSMTNVLGL